MSEDSAVNKWIGVVAFRESWSRKSSGVPPEGGRGVEEGVGSRAKTVEFQ